MTTTPDRAVDEVRAMLSAFAASPWRELYLRSAEWEMFLAKPGGASNPMRGAPPEVAKTSSTVDAPHLGLFFPAVRVGDEVPAGAIVGEIEVLGEREAVLAPAGGRVVEVMAGQGALVEYGAALVSLG